MATFRHCSKKPLKAMGNNGMDWAFCTIKDDDGYYCVYYVRPWAARDRKVYRMRSYDGVTDWTDSPDIPVLEGKVGTKYDGGVTCPTVWKERNYYHMIFSGLWNRQLNSGDDKYRAFYATSKNGTDWTVQNGGNPVIDIGGVGNWDHKHAEPTGVIKVGNKYYCWYNNIDCDNATARQMGIATSTDLLHWTKDLKNPIFDGGRFCPSPLKYNGKYYLFVCHFVSDIGHSEIELYGCDNPTFYPAERARIQVVKRWVNGSWWEANVLDPAYVLTDSVSRDTFSASNDELWMYYGASTGSTRGIGLCIEPLKIVQQS